MKVLVLLLLILGIVPLSKGEDMPSALASLLKTEGLEAAVLEREGITMETFSLIQDTAETHRMLEKLGFTWGERLRVLKLAKQGDQQGNQLSVPKKRLSTSTPSGVDGSSLWLKSATAKVVLGPDADVALQRSGPATLQAPNDLSVTGTLGVGGDHAPRCSLDVTGSAVVGSTLAINKFPAAATLDVDGTAAISGTLTAGAVATDGLVDGVDVSQLKESFDALDAVAIKSSGASSGGTATLDSLVLSDLLTLKIHSDAPSAPAAGHGTLFLQQTAADWTGNIATTSGAIGTGHTGKVQGQGGSIENAFDGLTGCVILYDRHRSHTRVLCTAIAIADITISSLLFFLPSQVVHRGLGRRRQRQHRRRLGRPGVCVPARRPQVSHQRVRRGQLLLVRLVGHRVQRRPHAGKHKLGKLAPGLVGHGAIKYEQGLPRVGLHRPAVQQRGRAQVLALPRHVVPARIHGRQRGHARRARDVGI